MSKKKCPKCGGVWPDCGHESAALELLEAFKVTIPENLLNPLEIVGKYNEYEDIITPIEFTPIEDIPKVNWIEILLKQGIIENNTDTDQKEKYIFIGKSKAWLYLIWQDHIQYITNEDWIKFSKRFLDQDKKTIASKSVQTNVSKNKFPLPTALEKALKKLH